MLAPFRLQAAIALAGVAILLAVVVAAAGVRSPEGMAQPEGSGDTYVEAMLGAPRFINPLLAASDTDRDLAHLVFSGLTRIDERGDIALDLASEWQVSPDGLVYTFTLKSDARWHDGAPVTSDDVLFTLDRLKSPDFPGDPARAAPWQAIVVEAPTQETVRFVLPTPNAGFVQYTTLGILPRHLWKEVEARDLARSHLNTEPVGAGPWRMLHAPRETQDIVGEREDIYATPVVGPLRPEEGVLLEPHPHLPPANPRISRIWLRLYPTFGAALTGFRDGEVHGLGHIPHDQLSEVEQTPGATVHRQTLARQAILLLNTRAHMLTETPVRQALEHAIDREAIVRESLGGEGQPATSPILRQSWAYDSTLLYRRHNLALSRQMLDEPGWAVGPEGLRVKDGVTLTLVLAANRDVPLNVEVAGQIQRSLRAAGIGVELALVGRETLLRDYLGPRAFHLALVNWEAQGADPDPYLYWHSSQANLRGGLNFSIWGNPQADAAIEAARSTTDREERKKHYAEFQRTFLDDAPAVVLFSPVYAYATRYPAQGVTLPSTDMPGPANRFDTLRDWYLQAQRLP